MSKTRATHWLFAKVIRIMIFSASSRAPANLPGHSLSLYPTPATCLSFTCTISHSLQPATCSLKQSRAYKIFL